MRLKLVYSTIIPLKGYKAITILFWMVVRRDRKDYVTWVDENHENIHLQQEIDLGFVLFYLWYGLEWLLKLPSCGFDTGRAYRSISFEMEAYGGQEDPGYLKNRRHYAWVRYIFKLKAKEQ